MPGKILEIIGWALGVAGLILTGVLVFTDGPIAHQITTVFPFLVEDNGQRLLVTLTAFVCVTPGVALAWVGKRLAGPRAVSDRWIASLTARQAMTRGRMLAVLVCVLVAALAMVALISLLPEIRASGMFG
jgi:hypothetical protein